MSPEAQAILQDWSPPKGINLTLGFITLVYLRGWFSLRRSIRGANWKLAAFASGVFSLWIAIGSPLSAFDESALTIHMIQHLLLMLVVPPLILLGAPAIPLLHGLPQWFVRRGLAPLLRLRWLRHLGDFVTHPVVCLLLSSITMIAWHIPSAFEFALQSERWHEVEHASFLATSILLWWPVVQPFPSESRWIRWSIPAYLFFAMIPGGILGAFLAFCDRVLYPSYNAAPRVLSLSPLSDQIVAGVLMWVLGTFVFVVPAVIIVMQLLSPARHSSPGIR
jgi:putative membrane protein